MVDWHDAYRLKVQPVAHTEREAEGPGHLDHIGNSEGPSTYKDNELILNNLERNTHLTQIPNHTPGTTTPTVPEYHSPVSDLSHLTVAHRTCSPAVLLPLSGEVPALQAILPGKLLTKRVSTTRTP